MTRQYRYSTAEKKEAMSIAHNLLFFLVRAPGFESATARSKTITPGIAGRYESKSQGRSI
jgi:hypothetical protein